MIRYILVIKDPNYASYGGQFLSREEAVLHLNRLLTTVLAGQDDPAVIIKHGYNYD